MAKSGKLRRRAKESLEEAKDRYVYGTLRKTGWVPSHQRKGR